MSQGFKKGSKWRTNRPAYLFLWLIQQFQLATRSTSPDMATVFHAWPYGRFIEMQNNLRKKKDRINQGSNFLGGSFGNIDNVIVPIQFRRECQPQHLKILFFHKNRLVVSPALKSTSGFLLHSTVSHSSDSSSDVNSSCCHRLDT